MAAKDTLDDMQKTAYRLQNEINELAGIRYSREYKLYENLEEETAKLEEEKAHLIKSINLLRYFSHVVEMMDEWYEE